MTAPRIHAAIYGLGGRDANGADLMAAAQAMIMDGPRLFSLNAQHETALPRVSALDILPPGAFVIRGHSVGGYGSVSANRIMATLLAELFALNVQAYPRHGSEKKGLPTDYHLIAATSPIHSHSDPDRADLIMLHDHAALSEPDLLTGLADGGIVIAQLPEPSRSWSRGAGVFADRIQAANAILYGLDALGIARALSPRPELCERMQGVVMIGALLHIAPIVRQQALSGAAVLEAIAPVLQRQFKRSGADTLCANLEAVRRGFAAVQQLNLAAAQAPQIAVPA